MMGTPSVHRASTSQLRGRDASPASGVLLPSGAGLGKGASTLGAAHAAADGGYASVPPLRGALHPRLLIRPSRRSPLRDPARVDSLLERASQQRIDRPFGAAERLPPSGFSAQHVDGGSGVQLRALRNDEAAQGGARAYSAHAHAYDPHKPDPFGRGAASISSLSLAYGAAAQRGSALLDSGARRRPASAAILTRATSASVLPLATRGDGGGGAAAARGGAALPRASGGVRMFRDSHSAIKLRATHGGGGGAGAASITPLRPMAYDPAGTETDARARARVTSPHPMSAAAAVHFERAAGGAELPHAGAGAGAGGGGLSDGLSFGAQPARPFSAAAPHRLGGGATERFGFAAVQGLTAEMSLDDALRRQRASDARLAPSVRKGRRLELFRHVWEDLIAAEEAEAPDTPLARLLPRIKHAYEEALGAELPPRAAAAGAGGAAGGHARADGGDAGAEVSRARAEERARAAELAAAAAAEELAQLRLLVSSQAAELTRFRAESDELRAESDELRAQCFAWADYHDQQQAAQGAAAGGGALDDTQNPMEAADAPPMLPVDPDSGSYTPRLGEGVLHSPGGRGAYARPPAVPPLDFSRADLTPSDDEAEEADVREGADADADDGEPLDWAGDRADAGSTHLDGADDGGGADKSDYDTSDTEGEGEGESSAYLGVSVHSSASLARTGPSIPSLNISLAPGAGYAGCGEPAADFDQEFMAAMDEAEAAGTDGKGAPGFNTAYEQALREGPSARASQAH